MVAERGDWRVEFARTDTDVTVASFDCEISQLSRYVSPKIGALSLRIPIPSDEVGADARKVLGNEGRLSMYAYRDGAIWWGGFVDTTRVTSGDPFPDMTVTGASFESYLDRREARTDEDLNMDQTAMAKWAWDYVQTSQGGNVRVDTPLPQASGRVRQMSWKRSDIKTVGSILKEVSNRADGFEWIIDCFSEAGTRRRRLTTGYPTIGRPDAGYSLTFPGNILSYEILSDALEGATSFQARGKAPDPVGTPNTGSRGVYDPATKTTTVTPGAAEPATKQEPIMSEIYWSEDFITAGYTLTDTTLDRPTVTEVDTLNDWAALARSMRSGPLSLPTITARMDGFSPAILGSVASIQIRDYPFPTGPAGEPGWQKSARVIGYEIDPGEFGADDVVKLILENPYDDDNMKRNPD